MKPDALERLSACRPDNPPLDAQERADLRASIVTSSPAPAKVVTRSLWRRKWGPALVFVGVATDRAARTPAVALASAHPRHRPGRNVATARRSHSVRCRRRT
jgi:hypothetical protein